MTSNATTPNNNRTALLRLESVVVAFGGLVAVSNIDLDVARGDRLAVLGPNGAGKTTLFNAIAGDITPTEGRVLIKGVDCNSLPSRLRPQLGVARTYQKTRLFAGLTVEDNLYLAQTGKQRRHLSLWRGGRDAELRERRKITECAYHRQEQVSAIGAQHLCAPELAHGAGLGRYQSHGSEDQNGGYI